MSQTSADFLDPSALMRIKSLQLRAKAVVDGLQSGIHRSPYHGFSAEFSEYRQYSPGDDPRYLDWRLFARSDRYFIKKFEDETNRRCYLLVDMSKSMEYGSQDYSKLDYAKTLAGTLAHFLAHQRDSVGLLLFADKVLDFHESRFRPGHLARLLGALEVAAAGSTTDLKAPLSQVASTVNHRGLIVLISDMLADTKSLRDDFGYLKSRGHDILVLRVLDPVEIDLSLPEADTIVDLETGREIYIDPETARQTYCEKFDAHEASIQTLCDEMGVMYSRLVTNQPLETALFDLIRSQAMRGRKTMRRSRTGGHA